jgi:hypothetical protein
LLRKIPRQNTKFCASCCLEYEKGEVYRLTEKGERVPVIVNAQTLEIIDVKALEVRLVGGETDRLENVAKVGTESSWMLIEFKDGRQKIYSPYNVVSIEEVARVQRKEKAAC